MLAAKEWIIKNQRGRRNLNESQRAMLGAKLEAIYAERAKQNMSVGGTKKGSANLPTHHARDEAASDVGVSSRSVGSAKKVLTGGDDALIESVEKGDIAVSVAEKLVGLSKDEQRDIAKKGKKAATKKADQLSRKKKPNQRDRAFDDLVLFTENSSGRKPDAVDPLWPNIDDNSLDWIITAPPTDDENKNAFEQLEEFALRALKPGGSLICITDQIHQKEAGFRLAFDLMYQWTLAIVTDDKANETLDGGEVMSAWRPALWLTKGEPCFTDPFPDVLDAYADDEVFGSGTSCDLRCIRSVRERVTNPGDKVCDPYRLNREHADMEGSRS